NVMDTAILLDAMLGLDEKDSKSVNIPMENISYYGNNFKINQLKGKRFGVFKTLLEDSLYLRAIEDLKSEGAILIEVEPEQIKLPDFLRLLNLDMKKDFTNYVKTSGDSNLEIQSIEDVMMFNKTDSVARMPYGQRLFAGIVADSASAEELETIKKTLKTNGKLFF